MVGQARARLPPGPGRWGALRLLPEIGIGNTFALTEGTLVLATVAQRYRMRPVVGPQVPADVQITYRPRGGLPIERVRRGGGTVA
jgi:cytochrome P450